MWRSTTANRSPWKTWLSLTYYSKSHFMKFFKAQMGKGFTEYLNDYRLTMAERPP